MLEILQYRFFVHAVVAAFLASVSCGIVGTYIVSKRIVFISGGISHASFGGVGMGYYLGMNPVLGAALFAVVSAVGFDVLSRKSDVRQDSLIGILWSLGMAVGILFVFLSPGYAPDLMGYLFGSILTVSRFDIGMMMAITFLIVMIFILMFKEILFIAFDEEYGRTQGIPVGFINTILIALVALTIVVNIRVMGIILVISLMTIPQVTANLFSKHFKHIIFYSIGFGLLSSLTGLFLSYALNIPSGASIIFCSVIVFSVLKIIRSLIVKIKARESISHT